MSDIIEGRVSLAAFRGLRRLRRLLVRRRARRRRGLGEVDPLPRPRARRVRRVLRAARHLRARRLQRLPDDGGAQGTHPRRGSLAALRQEHLRAVRGAAGRRWRSSTSPSLFFAGMAGSRLPVVTAHGEGRAVFDRPRRRRSMSSSRAASSTTAGAPTEVYPLNPNGSAGGLTAVTTADGRFTALMPHPERVFRTVQLSWHPRAGARTARGCGCSATRGCSSVEEVVL